MTFFISFFQIFFLSFLCFAKDVQKLDPIIVQTQLVDTATLTHINSDNRFGLEIPFHQHSRQQTLAGILQLMPGIYVQSDGMPYNRQYIRMRGLSSQQILVLVDGVPINSVFDGKANLSNINVAEIKKITLFQQGPAKTANEHLGGVVEIQTIESNKRPFSLSLGSGSFHTGFIRGLMQQKISSWNIIEQMELFSTQGNFLFFNSASNEFEKRINNDQKNISIKIASSKKIENQTIRLSFDTHIRNLGEPGFIFPSQNLLAKSHSSQQFFFAEYNKLFSDNIRMPEHNIKLSYQRNDWQYEDPDYDGKPTVRIFYDREEHNLFSHYQLTWIETPSIDLLTGVTIANQWIGIGRANHNLEQEEFPTRLKITSSLGSNLTLFDSQLTLSPVILVGNYSDVIPFASPQFGIIYKAMKNIRFKTNVARFFRAPSFDELYHPNQGYLIGNRNLRPETGYLFDGGLEYTEKKFDLLITYFRSLLGNEILYLHQNAFVVRPENIGSSEHEGMEFFLRYIFRNMSIITSYTFNNSFLHATQKRLPMTPIHQISIEFNISFLQNIYWKIQTHYYSETSGNLAQTLPVPEYLQTNTVLSFQDEHVFMNLNIDNIFNNSELQTMFKMPLPSRAFYATLGANL